jgi:hypothetical protein
VAYKLQAVTDTRNIGDEHAVRRFVYVDSATGKTMTLLEPLLRSDDVAGALRRRPTQHHETQRGVMKIVTTWPAPERKPRKA